MDNRTQQNLGWASVHLQEWILGAFLRWGRIAPGFVCLPEMEMIKLEYVIQM